MLNSDETSGRVSRSNWQFNRPDHVLLIVLKLAKITDRLTPPHHTTHTHKWKNPLALTKPSDRKQPRLHVLPWLDQILHDKYVASCGRKRRLSSTAAASFRCSPNKEAAGIMPSCTVPTQRGSEEKPQNGCLYWLGLAVGSTTGRGR